MSRDIEKPPVPWSMFDQVMTVVVGLGVIVVMILLAAGV